MSSGRGTSERGSNAEEVGHVLSGNLRQAELLQTMRECPPARTDAPTRSTPIQSPMFYQEPSTGFFVPVYSNIAPMQYVHAIPNGMMTGFNAEARERTYRILTLLMCCSLLQVHPVNR